MNKAKYTNLLRLLHGEFFQRFEIPHYFRDCTVEKVTGKASTIIGVRRGGKSSILFREIGKLTKEGVPHEAILYLNLEDDRIEIESGAELGVLLDSFYALYPENHERESYLFLDEIQQVEGWERPIRRFLDTTNARIFLSGSSARMLSTEIASTLRGRSLSTLVWPMGFREFVIAKESTLLERRESPAVRDSLRKLLDTYLLEGGFPEVLAMSPMLQHRTLQEYRDVMVVRDIIERHRISNNSLMLYLTKMILVEHGRLASVNKVFRDLKSRGFAVAKNTLHDYLVPVRKRLLLRD